MHLISFRLCPIFFYYCFCYYLLLFCYHIRRIFRFIHTISFCCLLNAYSIRYKTHFITAVVITHTIPWACGVICALIFNFFLSIFCFFDSFTELHHWCIALSSQWFEIKFNKQKIAAIKNKII